MATIGDISKHVLGNTILAQLTTRYPTPTASVSRRTYVVTGANTGLGFPLVAHLVALDAARNIFAVRGPAKGAAARDTILQGPPQYRGVLEVWELDMALFASVAQFAHRAEAELNRLDGAALNAGVATNGWHTTADGWETKSQVNALSTGLLAVLMLPLLYKTAHLPLLPDTDHIVPHLTITGSGAQNVANILDALNDETNFNSFDRYPTSKLFNNFIAKKTAAWPQAQGVIVNVVDPGMNHSDLPRDTKIPLIARYVARRARIKSSTYSFCSGWIQVLAWPAS
ncbi:hypothetical protein C8R43DRAFT_1132550 [Mycena crocata]|nr:hypothetical protein C8R43DRAFT_1132550 [Mycena crocata]